jgi:hypothetical protein
MHTDMVKVVQYLHCTCRVQTGHNGYGGEAPRAQCGDQWRVYVGSVRTRAPGGGIQPAPRGCCIGESQHSLVCWYVHSRTHRQATVGAPPARAVRAPGACVFVSVRTRAPGGGIQPVSRRRVEYKQTDNLMSQLKRKDFSSAISCCIRRKCGGRAPWRPPRVPLPGGMVSAAKGATTTG